MIYQVFIGNVRCCESVVNDVCEPSIFSLKISVGFVRSLLIFDRRTWLALWVYGWTPFKR
jgi:hypothetical protein